MDAVPGRLLVVEDDTDSRIVLSRILQRDGFAVSSACDGAEALQTLGGQPFDLVLLDIEMPGMNGFEVLREIRLTRPATQLPVVITTARGERKDIVLALSLGANDYISKPLDFQVVMARVRTQLAHKRAMDRIRALEEDLRRRNTELEEANDRMRRSLELASQMQQSLLPPKSLRLPGINFAWVYQPCDELGGDIFNIFPMGKNHIGFYLLDVSGHGVPAALLSVTLSRMLTPVPGQGSSLVEQQGPEGLEPRSPREVVEELNRRFQMSGDNMQYFTVFYGILDVPRRQLRYVCAGNPPALHVPKGGDPRFLGDSGFAIGWFATADFEEQTVELTPGDRLYLYSDGCTEAIDSASQQFGRQRLADSCCLDRGSNLQNSLNLLVNRVTTFRGNAPNRDDLSALALEIAPP